MVIAIMQTTSDRLRTVFRLKIDFRQTSDRRQTPTSDFGPRPDFEHQTSDFGLLTLNFTLQILDFGQTSDFGLFYVPEFLRIFQFCSFWLSSKFVNLAAAQIISEYFQYAFWPKGICPVNFFDVFQLL